MAIQLFSAQFAKRINYLPVSTHFDYVCILCCRFNEEEVSLDDMRSSNTAYLKEDYVKRKFMATWQELCDMLKIPSTIEVTHEDDNYSGTSYPEVNRRVQRLLRSDEFPDYVDISELIDRSNTKHSLGISAVEKTEMARKVFKDVGKIIKSRRVKDYQHHFGSHLTDAVKELDDPATSDDVLLQRLRESLEEGQGKMESLVEEFVVKQELEQEKGSGSPQSDSCKEEEEEEEEEEEGQGGLGVIEEDGEEEEEIPGDKSDRELSPNDTGPPRKKIKTTDSCSSSGSPIHSPENGRLRVGSSVEGGGAELPSSTGITDIISLSSSDSDSDVIICDDI